MEGRRVQFHSESRFRGFSRSDAITQVSHYVDSSTVCCGCGNRAIDVSLLSFFRRRFSGEDGQIVGIVFEHGQLTLFVSNVQEGTHDAGHHKDDQ